MYKSYKQVSCNKSSQLPPESKKKNSKSKKIPSGQPFLMDFLKKSKHETSIVASTSTSATGLITNALPSEADEGSFFILLFSVKKSLTSIKPIVLHVYDKEIPRKSPDEITVIVRFRINNESFVGRIIMISRVRVALEEHIPKAIDVTKSKCDRNRALVFEPTVYSLTKHTILIIADPHDPRSKFLGSLFSKATENVNHITENQNQFVRSPENMVYGQIDNDSDATEEIPDDEQILDVSSDTNDYEQTSSRKKLTKKRKMHNYSEKKMICKIMDKRNSDNMKANTEISYALDKLEEMIPTLSPSSAMTPIIRNLFILTKNINFKLNHRNNDHETRFPLSRNITTVKVNGKDEIKLGGKISLPMTGYAKAIEAQKPSLVVSRIVRSCFPSSLKLNCEVNEAKNDTNLLWRLGNEAATDEARMKEGQEILDTLIEHAHAIKSFDSMSLTSYRECMHQVDKALYDFNRRHQLKESDLNKKQTEDSTFVKPRSNQTKEFTTHASHDTMNQVSLWRQNCEEADSILSEIAKDQVVFMFN
ncbi:uncharacterized protein LOC112538587 [Tetranychus urticae]|uniref:Uncharacterized protein n=1 Tax=Tetranychus urticae TaxID=32264 RepID=T1JQV6_TETUR|nr:uncharacterized protein LOC112538587 [Tetranychus urticae]